MDQQEQLFTIQQLSLKLGIPKSTLRFWEKELGGIIMSLRTRGRQRRYTVEHISIIEEIKNMSSRGLSLTEIKRTLGNSNYQKNKDHADIDLFAGRVAEVVKAEVLRFFERGEGSKKP